MIKCNEIGGNMYLVEALDTYKENNIQDNVLGRIPAPGEQFEVCKERLEVLLGNNSHKLVFVKVIKAPEEKQEKRTIKKKKTKLQ